MQDLIFGAAVLSLLTCPASPFLAGRAPRLAWVAWVIVVVALIASITGWAVYHDAAKLGRLSAIDACAARGGKAVVSRDGWWCEKPGALP